MTCTRARQYFLPLTIYTLVCQEVSSRFRIKSIGARHYCTRVPRALPNAFFHLFFIVFGLGGGGSNHEGSSSRNIGSAINKSPKQYKIIVSQSLTHSPTHPPLPQGSSHKWFSERIGIVSLNSFNSFISVMRLGCFLSARNCTFF